MDTRSPSNLDKLVDLVRREHTVQQVSSGGLLGRMDGSSVPMGLATGDDRAERIRSFKPDAIDQCHCHTPGVPAAWHVDPKSARRHLSLGSKIIGIIGFIRLMAALVWRSIYSNASGYWAIWKRQRDGRMASGNASVLPIKTRKAVDALLVPSHKCASSHWIKGSDPSSPSSQRIVPMEERQPNQCSFDRNSNSIGPLNADGTFNPFCGME